jgi:hypothetical protein
MIEHFLHIPFALTLEPQYRSAVQVLPGMAPEERQGW